jgi:hypothetical protein
MNSRGGHHSQGPSNHYKIGSKLKLGAATSTNFMKNVNQPNSFNMSMLRSVQQNMPNEYNYKIPAVASQSKIMSNQVHGTGGSQGSSSIGAAYRGNARKFVMQNPN